MTGGNGAGAGQAGGVHGSDYPKGPLLRPTRWWRQAVFLTGNLAAYAFINAFVHFLGSGAWFSTSPAEYQRWAGRPFSVMLTEPLSIFTHPWMILIIGLLLAAVVIVPLLVACLYHSRVSALFLLCVAVLAHSPVLTLVLAAGCMLVAATDLRRRNPSLALLLGLIPAGVYMYLSAKPRGVVVVPMQQLMLYVPFVVAGLGALVAGGLVLLIAHWVRYRPGVIWPVLAVLAAAPVWVFHREVGPDELAFGILAGQLTDSETMFADEAIARGPDEAVLPTSKQITAARTALEKRKEEWIRRCDRFLRDHPTSRRRSAVLWMKGIAQDTQVSVLAMYDGYIRYYDDYPLEASTDTWRELTERFSGESVAAVGQYRLAMLAGRAGRVDEALAHLDVASRGLSDVFAALPVARRESPWSGLFGVTTQRPSRGYLQRVATQVNKLRWLIAANRAAVDEASAEAFREFISLDRRRHSRQAFAGEINDLAERFEDAGATDLADNLELALAMNSADVHVRARRLLQLENESALDASIEANFELGRLALQAAHDEGLARMLRRPELYFRRVKDAQANPWQRQADEYLTKLSGKGDARP